MIDRRQFLSTAVAAGICPPQGAGRTVCEPAREVPVAGEYDLIVAGGGPAGIAAAVTAARAGVKTLLLERQGQLGGIWTSGCLACLLGFNETPFDREILGRLRRYGALSERKPKFPSGWLCEPEYMKLVCEELCEEAGVDFILHTSVVAAVRDGNRLEAVVTESKAGRQAWKAGFFADCTGDGDLGALAGCGFDVGGNHPQDAEQPASLLSLILLPNGGEATCIANDPVNFTADGGDLGDPKGELLKVFERAGVRPSYGHPTLFRLHGPVFQLMADHQYGVAVDDVRAITKATVRARKELSALVTALAEKGGKAWEGARLISTAAQLGHRRARRLHGLYRLSVEDAVGGRTFADAVTTCRFGLDVHAVTAEVNRMRPAGNPLAVGVKPYQIPLRSCMSADIGNLYMAGRCISGDFLTQASYRITATAIGTGVGIAKAIGGKLKKEKMG